MSASIDIVVSVSYGNVLEQLIANCFPPTQGKLLHHRQVSTINSRGDTGGLGTSRDEAASSSRVQQRMAWGGHARTERKGSNQGENSFVRPAAEGWVLEVAVGTFRPPDGCWRSADGRSSPLK